MLFYTSTTRIYIFSLNTFVAADGSTEFLLYHVWLKALKYLFFFKCSYFYFQGPGDDFQIGEKVKIFLFLFKL